MLNEENLEPVHEEENLETTEPSETGEEPSGGVEPDDGAQDGGEENLILGKFKSQEDLVAAYTKLESHASQVKQENQTLRSTAQQEPEKLDPNAKAIVDQLRDLGFVRQEDIAKNNAILTQKQKDDLEIASLSINPQQEAILRQVALQQDNLQRSMTDVWKDLQSAMGASKVISKKTTIKPKGGKNVSTEKELSPTEVAALPQKEYDEYWAKRAKEQAEAA